MRGLTELIVLLVAIFWWLILLQNKALSQFKVAFAVTSPPQQQLVFLSHQLLKRINGRSVVQVLGKAQWCQRGAVCCA
jgi:hypothetical protein